MSYYKKKPNNKNTNTVISVIVVILVATLVLSLFGVFSKKDDEYNRVYTTWEVGEIYGGEVLSTSDTCMTSSYFEINDGIKFELEDNFIFNLYMVEFYDENKEFIRCIDLSEDVTNHHPGTDEYTLAQMLSNTEIDKTTIKYARITISLYDDNNHINFFEMLNYASKIKLYTLKADN